MRMFETDAVENMLVKIGLEIRARLRVFKKAKKSHYLANLTFQIRGDPVMFGWPQPFYKYHLLYQKILRFSHVSIAFHLPGAFVLR